MSICYVCDGHCVIPPNCKTGLMTELDYFPSFTNSIGCRVYTAEDRVATGFKNIFSQSYSKKKTENQMSFPNGSLFRGVIDSPVKELLKL